MRRNISVANLVMLGGGAVAFFFSFFNFVETDSYTYAGRPTTIGHNVWSSSGGAWFTTIPALLAAAMVVWSVLELAGTQLPAQVLTFNSLQLKATWGIGASGVMLALLLSDMGSDRGLGFWFMLIGSLAMATGAVMALLGKWSELVALPAGQSGPSAPPPPPPGAMPPPPPPAG